MHLAFTKAAKHLRPRKVLGELLKEVLLIFILKCEVLLSSRRLLLRPFHELDGLALAHNEVPAPLVDKVSLLLLLLAHAYIVIVFFTRKVLVLVEASVIFLVESLRLLQQKLELLNIFIVIFFLATFDRTLCIIKRAADRSHSLLFLFIFLILFVLIIVHLLHKCGIVSPLVLLLCTFS
jgi:hypothetical protein